VTRADFRLRIGEPSLAEVAAAAERLERWALAARIRFEPRRQLLLVFDELATNVAKHAEGARELAIGAQRTPSGGVRLELEDDGIAFDPFARPDPDTTLPLELREPGGLGVHLVRRLAARADYRRVDGRNRVEVELAP
jgi:anti-sigma regulatory factor (Ser/Thr protein kinase)